MTHTTGVAKDDMSLLAAPNNIVEVGSLHSIVEKHVKGRLAGTPNLMKVQWEDVSNLISMKKDQKAV